MIDINQFLTPEIMSSLRLLAVVLAVFHLIIALVLFIQVAGVNRMIKTPHGNLITAIGLFHMVFLVIILLLVVFY